MISVICGTNRPNSRSSVVAKYYVDVLKTMTNEDINYVALDEFPMSTLSGDMYDVTKMSPETKAFQEKYFDTADRIFFIIPEYNGGVPGVFKVMIDVLSMNNYKENFGGRKVCLTGVSAGRAGNSRGLDYLTNTLGYMTLNVFSKKLPISGISTLIDNDRLVDKATQEVIERQIEEFLNY